MLTKNFYNTEVRFTQTLVNILSLSTTDINCTGVDGRGYESIVHVVAVGDSGDTLSGALMVELELEESDDDVTYTDCANAALENPTTGAAGHVTGTNLGTFAVIDAPAEDSAMFAVRYVGTRRYSRVVVNKTGTHTNGVEVHAFAMRARPTVLPAA
jgi:hypothetical protein